MQTNWQELVKLVNYDSVCGCCTDFQPGPAAQELYRHLLSGGVGEEELSLSARVQHSGAQAADPTCD